MRAVAPFLVALSLLGACTDLPDRAGQLVDACTPIDAAAYAAARADGGAWRELDYTGGGFHGQGAGHSRKRCWPRRARGVNNPDQRCVQRNDLVVEMRTDTATTYYRIPARTTHALYGEGGVAICRIVQDED